MTEESPPGGCNYTRNEPPQVISQRTPGKKGEQE